MALHHLLTRTKAHAGRGFIAATEFATRRGLVRGPSHATDVVGDGAFRYRVEPAFCRVDPSTHPVDNCHELAFDAAGRLYVLTDHPQNNVLVFDADGHLVNAWTLGAAGAHGLTLVREGEAERLFVCDAYGGRVVKTSLAGEVLLELPTPHALGVYGATEPYEPTQTAVGPNGDVYVADGYGSQRVLRFDAGGRFVGMFGGRRAGDASLDFAHGVAVDDRRGPGNETLLVTSRVDQCFKRFDLEGRYLGRIDLPGGYPCRPVIHGPHVYVGLCWSGAHLRPNTGFVVVLGPDDRVVATLGGHQEQVGRRDVLRTDYSVFRHVHDVAVDAAGNLFVAQWNAGRTYPMKLSRIAD